MDGVAFPSSGQALIIGSPMKISQIYQDAIAARMALTVGAEEFERLFLGVEFYELDGDILFVSALDESLADEMEEKYALHISIIASKILQRPIAVVMVLPKAMV
jgi:hypothetical protein